MGLGLFTANIICTERVGGPFMYDVRQKMNRKRTETWPSVAPSVPPTTNSI